MTKHTVRCEEINGKLLFEMPADVAKRLGFAGGGEATTEDGEASVTLAPNGRRKQDQLAQMMRIIGEDDAVLAALAK